MKKLTLFLFSLVLLTACGTVEPGQSVDRERPFLGNADAPVLIEEFSDLQCPACAAISPQVERIVRNNPTLFRMDYYHYPLAQHQYAFSAAEASECAADQGQFWEYIALTFKSQPTLAKDNLVAIAEQMELDMEVFETCLDDRQNRDRVSSDLSEGRSRSVSSTPSFFVNGTQVRFTGYDSFEAYLKSVAVKQ